MKTLSSKDNHQARGQSRKLLAISLLLCLLGAATGETDQPSPFALPAGEDSAPPTEQAVKTGKPAPSPFSLPPADVDPAAIIGSGTPGAPDNPAVTPDTDTDAAAAEAAPAKQAAGEREAAQELFSHGTALARRGDYQQAEEILTRVIKRDPGNVRALNNLGLVLRKLGNNEEALSTYQRAVEADADYALTYKNIGVLLEQMQETAGAVRAYRDYTAKAPQAADAATVKARADWLAQKNHDQKAL